ncbi:hypothetical protein NJ76_01860 [Rhodococcus sp. IITR03]|nr:hypothetical protein NJ76_01860 [Rhodococcus sp. IITR03]
MLGTELGGAVTGGIAVPLQHRVGAWIRLGADVPAVRAGAAHPDPVVESLPPQVLGEDLLGHRRPTDVAGAHEGHVEAVVSVHP